MAGKSKDEYMEPIVYRDAGAIIRVYRPILTEEERERRMKRLHDAAAALLKSCTK